MSEPVEQCLPKEKGRTKGQSDEASKRPKYNVLKDQFDTQLNVMKEYFTKPMIEFHKLLTSNFERIDFDCRFIWLNDYL